jgi:predicted transposase/invertase (TIGR01784 family)
MAEPLTNPHDRFFKEVFSRQETARDFLQHYLPQEVAALLDLSTLEISKDTFIDPDLQEHFSDLLYKITLHQGQETFVYVLFEHKSYPDTLIAFQLLHYMVRIWEQSLRQNQPFRPILPLVVYHGRSRWTVATHFTALLDLPAELRPYVPEYHYWLCDLTQYSDAEIKGEVILRVALLLLKYIFRDDLAQRLGEILGLLRALSERQTGLEYLETILRYITGSTDRVSEAELRRVVIEVIEQGGTLMPTLVEQWLERGRQEGLERGREEGREAALNILRRFLVHRFGAAPDQFDETLQELDLATITQLSEAAFEAKDLAEFEAALTKLHPQDNGKTSYHNGD